MNKFLGRWVLQWKRLSLQVIAGRKTVPFDLVPNSSWREVFLRINPFMKLPFIQFMKAKLT